MRDMFNHEMTLEGQWKMSILPNFFTKYEVRHGRFVGENDTVTPSYDPMCATLSEGCYPVAVIDPVKLVEDGYGPLEARKLAKVVNGTEGFDEWMIEEEVRQSNRAIVFAVDIIVMIRYKETHQIAFHQYHPHHLENILRHGSAFGTSSL